MRPYKFYIFDLDGTLVDTHLDIARALQKTLEEAGLPVPGLDEVSRAIGGGAKNAVSMLTGLTGDDVLPHLERFTKDYEQMCCDNTRVYEGGESLLRRLKESGAKLAVVTMKFKAATLKILDAHGLDMLDAVVTFDDVNKRKPDPESLFALCKKFGVDVADTLVIGDTVTDIRYAQAAGADCCAVEYGYGETEDLLALKPTYAVKSLLEI
jgi:phosphoglycolate phosphatase